MRLLLLCGVVLGLGCGRSGLAEELDAQQPPEVHEPPSTTDALTGTWALGADTIRGLPSADFEFEGGGTPYALLNVYADGTFVLQFGSGCVIEGTSGEWTPLAQGVLLTPRVDDWSTWTDGVSERPRPAVLVAVRDGEQLRISGVDEKGQPIDQRWRPYAP
ncbi:MAG: hypothetical protein IT380_24455 [Myxococcales bacterium]|nr:hypothetical protein [Myxococcales bacterium]